MARRSKLPIGRTVKRQAAQTQAAPDDTPAMGKKLPEDYEVAARVRAHLRAAMKERGISKAEAVRRLGTDDGNFSRILNGERKSFSGGMLLRISKAFQINPTRLLGENPAREFFEGEEPPPELK